MVFIEEMRAITALTVKTLTEPQSLDCVSDTLYK